MATTRLSDVIVPSVFASYVQVLTTETSGLFQSGIIIDDPAVQALAQGAGKTFNMPFFNDLSNTSSNISSDDPAVLSVPLKIGASQDVAVKHYRNQSWSSADLVPAIIGVDPMDVIARRVADYWVRDFQRVLIASLNGVIADNVANDASDMVLNVATDGAGAMTSAEQVTADTVITAQQTMGDAQTSLVAIVMHSVIYSNLRKQNLIDFIPDAVNAAAAAIPTYLGMTVIVDDSVPAVAGSNRITYTTYLFGRGAVAYGEGTPKTPVEVERAADQGNGEGVENLHSRRHFIMHPRGIKFTNSSVVGASPTDAELAAAANWDRVYSRKLVRFAALKTNG